MATRNVDLGITGITDAVEIGRGGFAVVYRALQPKFRRSVAVKVLSMSATDEVARSRFDRECQAMGLLSDHPNIVTVYESGYTDSGQPYLVMAYLARGSLADRLAREHRLPPAEVVDIGITVAEALNAAHEAGVLHRDVKPSNILVSNFDEPQLADFGIARLAGETLRSRTGLALSPLYAPPEVLSGHPPTRASDVYSLAASLYELLAGRPAFLESDDDGIYALLARVGTDPVPDLRPLGVPDALAGAIERAMDKDPEARTPSASAFATDLRDARAAMNQVAATPGPPPPLRAEAPGDERAEPLRPSGRPPERGRRLAVIASVLAAVVALVIGGVALLGDEDGGGPGPSTPGPSTPGTTGTTVTASEVKLRGPRGVATGGAGDLFIADSGAHVVRKLDAQGAVATVAGTGAAGFSGDGGPAAAAQLNNPYAVAVARDGVIYVADDLNNRVRRIDRDGTITTVAGGGRGTGDGGQATQAALVTPTGVVVAADGTLYVAEAHGHRIRKVATDRTISTVAGTGQEGSGGDGGPATAARLNTPIGLALGPDGAVYVADREDHRIRRIGTDGIITTVAGTGAPGFSGDGGRASEAALNKPTAVAVAADGTVYVADSENHRIRRIDGRGTISTAVGTGRQGSAGDQGPATAATLFRPEGVAIGPDGTLFIAEEDGDRIRRVGRDGLITTPL